MFDVDTIVIGAGVVGLAVGRELAQNDKTVAVLEKNTKYGLETSSRNSEVIHAGIHYPSDSLKAKFCVEGNRLIYETVEKNGILHRKTGKVTVASSEAEIPLLEKIYAQGKENGVTGMTLLSKRDIQKLLPNVNAAAGLLTPSSGIINVHNLMDYLADSFRDNGGLLALNEEVCAIEKIRGGYTVVTNTAKYTTATVVNCAGLFADRISNMLDINYFLYWAKGDYFSLNQKFSLTKLVYPVPAETALGIHLTPKIGGGYRLGPDIEYVEKKAFPYPNLNSKSDFGINEDKKEEFYKNAAEYLPELNKEQMSPEMYGIRPKLQGPDDSFKDFVIRDESENGAPGLVNLIGIDSPGLTSCLAIARYVKKLLEYQR